MGREIKAPRAWYKPLGVMIPAAEVESINFEAKVIGVYLEIDGRGYHKLRLSDFELMRPLGLVDKNGEEMHESDITELEVSGIKRRFVVKTGTVIREVKSHPSFDDDFAKVAITGVYFEWQGYQLFPCVDGSGVSDVAKMTVIGNIYEHPHLLPNREEQ